jgi:hydroxymethylglutaryl-CoA lyase
MAARKAIQKARSAKAAAKLAPWPRRASIFEVGPRDGLQAESKILDVETKIGLVQKLVESGLSDIEVGSFVRADRIPQLQDTDKVVTGLEARLSSRQRKGCRFWAFVPNERGLDMAIDAGLNGASFFIAASDTFCRKNINRSISEVLEYLPGLLQKARKAGLKTRVYLSTLVYCPYEGPTPPAKVLKLTDRLLDMGAQEVALSDTTGDANPRSLRKVLSKTLEKHPAKRFALHLHDTRGLALANVLEGLSHGLTRFDSSCGGLGGCPYAPGASGNLATEDLANMLSGMDLQPGVDLGLLAQAGFLAERALGKALPSHVLRTLEQKK